MDYLSRLNEFGVVPVIVLEDSKDAIPLAQVLIDAGLPCAEITFRTDAAAESIRIISNKFPNMLIGAGTVTSIEQIDQAIAAGAKFIVSPGFNNKLVDYCCDNNICIIPGCVTPSEIMDAITYGLSVVKFFPAGQFGGIDMLKALSAPFPNIKFVPTGGVNESNLKDYLNLKCTLACGGTWIANKELICSGNFDAIKEKTAKALALVKEARGEI